MSSASRWPTAPRRMSAVSGCSQAAQHLVAVGRAAACRPARDPAHRRGAPRLAAAPSLWCSGPRGRARSPTSITLTGCPRCRAAGRRGAAMGAGAVFGGPGGHEGHGRVGRRQGHVEAAADARRAAHRDRAAHAGHQGLHDRHADAGALDALALGAEAVEGSNRRSSCAPLMPRPLSTTLERHAGAVAAARDAHPPPGRLYLIALVSRFTSTCSARVRSASAQPAMARAAGARRALRQLGDQRRALRRARPDPAAAAAGAGRRFHAREVEHTSISESRCSRRRGWAELGRRAGSSSRTAAAA